ncbi:MAG: OmpA family protein [Desulfuromonadales bacterium]|nr:OmpA family protein [Desulfuromonadales bacterium]MBN2792638.1 OmpA family protein [Desulfuromonadales bacterium]
MFKKLVLTVAALCCLAFPVAAEIQPGAFTLSPMFGGHLFDGDQSLETSSFWGLGLGYNLDENWALEGVYTRTDADAEDSSTTDTEVETIRLDALYHFRPTEKLVPYLVAGLGGIYSDPDVGTERDHLLFNYGVGVKYFILDNLIALRADVRHLLDFPEPDHNLQYSAGLVFQLGKPAPAPVPVAAPAPTPVPTPAPVDSDGDGVIDTLDQCPGTAPGVAVDSKGCPLDSDKDGIADYLDQCPNTPAGVAVDNTGCPLDSDGDGVFDYLDQCPNTPAGAPVDSKGCPLDSDGDGVFDYLDQCPGTPAGVSVDEQGCPTVLTLHINFGHDSSQVGPQYDGEIAKAAQCIRDYPGNVVFIDGHTDSTGSAEYNQKLSVQRAQAVVNRLIEKFNIPESRMTARGFGEDKPVANNKIPEGRALNRRVEVACGAK